MAFDLSSISTARSTLPPRTVVYGDKGLGKTTFATSAPNAIVIQTEDGLGQIEVAHFPLAKDFGSVMEAISTLYTDEHPFQSLVVDSLDWLEPLIWQAACAAHGKNSIEDFGYGKGYIEALAYWRQFFDGINALRTQRQMNIILLAHSQVIHIEDPLLAAYDSHALKLHKRAAALVEEWADIIGFAQLRVLQIEEKKASFTDKDAKRVRAKAAGQERLLNVAPSPAFTAKNRYNLPPVLPLEWSAFAAALSNKPAAVAAAA